MKILFTVDFYEPSVGGTQKVVKTIAEGLARRGHSITVATTKLPERTIKVINKVRIEEFEIKGNAISGMTGEIQKYRDFLIKGNFDVIFNYAAQQWSSDIMFQCLKNIKAKKVIVPCGFSALQTWYAKRYFREMPYWLSFYDAIIFTSKEYQDYEFVSRYKIPNTTVIANGASKLEFLKIPKNTIKKKLGIPKNHALITLIGTHTGQKGHQEAIEIFTRANIQSATLLLIGNTMGNGCFKNCVHAKDAYNNTNESILKNKKIIIADLQRSDTIQALFSSDLFLFPSQIECAPLVVYESLASGTPFLASNVGNVQEIVNQTKAGWILPTVKKGNAGFVRIAPSAKMLEEVIGDRKRLKKMGHIGRKAWLKAFTFEKLIVDYEAVLKDIVSVKKQSKGLAPSLAKKTTSGIVDVVIPTYNTGKFIEEAVESVMIQGKSIRKLYIIDDGSTDDTKKIIKKLQKKYSKVEYIYQRNKGLSAARNAGIRETSAEYVAFLDADDVWKEGKIDVQLAKFKSSPYKNIGLVYGEYEDIDVAGKRIEKLGGFRLDKKVRGKVLRHLLKFNYATGSGSGVLVKRACFEKAGLFDETLHACEDWDMWIRIAEEGYEFDYVNKEIVSLRRRKKSMQADGNRMLLNTVIFFNKYLHKGYEIPPYHKQYIRGNVMHLMFMGPQNLPFLYTLRQRMSKELAKETWPYPWESVKAVAWVFYAKANQILKKIKNKKNTITVIVNGGLGNQLFQYACGKALALKHDATLVLDTSFFSLKGQTKRSFLLNKFKIDATQKRSSQNMVSRLSRNFSKLNILQEKSYTYDSQIKKAAKNTTLNGYWQSPKYFEKYHAVIRENLKPIKKIKLSSKVAKIIENEVTVSVHVRRGDYITNKEAVRVLGAQPLQYYENAYGKIKKIEPNAYYIILSDDIAWCRRNLANIFPKGKTIFFSKDEITDLYLMTKTTHNIIANSSYSWWGAWLNSNPHKKVIAPKRWFNDPSYKTTDLFPKDWMLV